MVGLEDIKRLYKKITIGRWLECFTIRAVKVVLSVNPVNSWFC